MDKDKTPRFANKVNQYVSGYMVIQSAKLTSFPGISNRASQEYIKKYLAKPVVLKAIDSQPAEEVDGKHIHALFDLAAKSAESGERGNKRQKTNHSNER